MHAKAEQKQNISKMVKIIFLVLFPPRAQANILLFNTDNKYAEISNFKTPKFSVQDLQDFFSVYFCNLNIVQIVLLL